MPSRPTARASSNAAMLKCHESRKSSSTRPVGNRSMALDSSTLWKTASWVRVPSVSVTRRGRVTPFESVLILAIFAGEEECRGRRLVESALPAAPAPPGQA